MSGVCNSFLLQFKTRFPRIYIFFQPFFSTPTIAIMLLYGIWSYLVIEFDLYTTFPDVSGPFAILGSTIAVTLPLLASAAVQRNKESLFNYNAFCGDVLALGWEILSYVRDPKDFKVSNPNALKIQQSFEICLILPTVVKWKFRDNANFNIDQVYMIKNYNYVLDAVKVDQKLKRRGAILELRSASSMSVKRRRLSMVNYKNTSGDSMGREFVDTSIGKEYRKTLLQMGGKIIDGDSDIGIDKCDLLFVFLFDLISEFDVSDTRKNMLTRTAERVYGSYGNMGNISSYKIPLMYETYMHIAIVVFMFTFPFTYGIKDGSLVNYDVLGVNESYWNAMPKYSDSVHNIADRETDIVWHGLLVIYFLLGMHLMTIKVSNAFVSTVDAIGFTTVGKSESDTNTSLHNIYKKRLDLQKNMQVFSKSFNDMPSSPRGESKSDRVSLLTNRRKLYV